MSMKHLARAIGMSGYLQTPEGFALEVMITDVKNSYGDLRFEVQARDYHQMSRGHPAVGPGETEGLKSTWVRCDRVLVTTPNGVVSGVAFAKGDVVQT